MVSIGARPGQGQRSHGPPHLIDISCTATGALPDRITIYRRAICAVCNSHSEVVEQVRRTVIHEVVHHFGIGDARLRELGW
jgi:predicted Zn-dependent protease with MMP-like domain